jgi:glutamate dehydrogenase (NAD(P)+)
MITERVRDPKTGLEAALAIVSPIGLAFGGTRFSPNCSVEEVQELALCMDLKLRGHTQAVHGAKAGFFCAPDHAGLPGLMALAAEKWRPYLEERLVLGKDMGASNALLDQFYAQVGQDQLAPVEGDSLPARLRELVGYRPHMTGQGVCWALSEFVGGSLNGFRVAIQGFGAVGLGAAIRLNRAGAEILGISDVDGAFSFQISPNEEQLLAMAIGGRCAAQGLDYAVRSPREALFSFPVDALVLAADSHSVGAAEAGKIVASVVVEGSNFGLEDAALSLLKTRGVPVVPDVIASSASAAMVALQMEAGGALTEAALWRRIEASIRAQAREGLTRR